MNDWGAVWWAGLTAFTVALAGFVAVAVRAGVRRIISHARAGFVDWFGESIDTHVAPKFEAIRDELHESAAATQLNSRDAAEAIKERTLQLVHAEVEPLRKTIDDRTPMFDRLELALKDTQAVLNDHMTHDNEVEDARVRLRAEDGATLVAGQAHLLNKLDEHHAEAMSQQAGLEAKVDDHITADAEAFARIEGTIKEKP